MLMAPVNGTCYCEKKWPLSLTLSSNSYLTLLVSRGCGKLCGKLKGGVENELYTTF